MSLFREDLLDQVETRKSAPAAHTLLLVDDEVGNLRVMRSLFSQRFRVLEASDGAEALEVLGALPADQLPAVILSDQRMPRMTGVELFERVRESMPLAIRIIITGFVDVGAIVDAINRAGIYKFMVKPFDHEALKLTVERAVEAFEMRRQIDQHVLELEAKILERTRELQASNQALRQANIEIERASLTDPLTGLGNRRSLVGALAAECAGSAVLPRRALLLVDIDHFKAVNDCHGHAAGDAVLRGFAEVLHRHCRSGELAARWGGEEFLLLLNADDESLALARAEQIRSAVEATSFDIGEGCRLPRTCSIGVACWPFSRDEPARLGWEQVLAIADGALYIAKRGGRNQAICLRQSGRLAEGAEQKIANDLAGLLASGTIAVVSGR